LKDTSGLASQPKMPNSFLPREGLTLEAAFAPFRLTLLQPLLSGPLLLAAYRFPTSLAAKWPFLRTFEDLFRSHRLKTGLCVLFCIGLLRKINKTLNKLVLNNFTNDKTWDWSKELVLITGGSAGIGALMVKIFAEKNITVVILDIVDPPETISSRTTPLFFKSVLD
jgi:all-trans-retinol dehydrogenase (NAD+)